MATLHARGVPDDLYEVIAELAEEHDSSITAETIRLLRRAVSFERPGQAALIEEIIATRPAPRTGGPSAAELIRMDRDSR
jgi:plasmid stability protein